MDMLAFLRVVLPMLGVLLAPWRASCEVSLYLQGPPSASPEDLDKAAAGLMRRCSLFGHKNVASRCIHNGKDFIQLTFKDDPGSDYRKDIACLTSMAVNMFEVRASYGYPLRNGSLIDKSVEELSAIKAPDGNKWYHEYGGVPECSNPTSMIKLLPIALPEQSPALKRSSISKLIWKGKDIPLHYNVDPKAASEFIKQVYLKGKHNENSYAFSYKCNYMIDNIAIANTMLEHLTCSETLSVNCPLCSSSGKSLAPATSACSACAGKGVVDINSNKDTCWIKIVGSSARHLDAMLRQPLPFPLRVLSPKEEEGATPMASPVPGPVESGKNPPERTALSPLPDETARNCQMWLLLARNFYNQNKYDLAEANIKKILDSKPDEKMVEAAKELLNRIQADK
jgi:hypothetical protein